MIVLDIKKVLIKAIENKHLCDRELKEVNELIEALIRISYRQNLSEIQKKGIKKFINKSKRIGITVNDIYVLVKCLFDLTDQLEQYFE